MTKFFDSTVTPPTEATSFAEFGLSSRLMKSLNALSFTTPTPIQSQLIPLALQGRDICASSPTGSGKTLAFLLPTVERLLRNPKNTVLILSPTRELATQTFSVLTQLIQYTRLTALLVTGGSVHPADEEARLLQNPSFIVATPGRLVDHLINSEDFSISDRMVLILDEADRLLEEGFQKQLEEIISKLPEEKQAILVTATMTSSVSQLSELALKNPLRIEVDTLFQLNQNLAQEFVKVDNTNRDATLVAIISRIVDSKTVIFFNTKKSVHRMYHMLTLLGFKVAELQGDMSQLRRYDSLSQFASGNAAFLLATDVAARGLDIKGVENVINYNMPKKMKEYVHRVGRTARIGGSGKTVAFVGESDRDLMKSIIQNSEGVMKRTIPESVLESTQKKIDMIKEEINLKLAEEKEMTQLELAEKALQRAKEVAAGKGIIREKRSFVDKEKRKPNDVGRVKAKIERIKRRSSKFMKKAKSSK